MKPSTIIPQVHYCYLLGKKSFFQVNEKINIKYYSKNIQKFQLNYVGPNYVIFLQCTVADNIFFKYCMNVAWTSYKIIVNFGYTVISYSSTINY